MRIRRANVLRWRHLRRPEYLLVTKYTPTLRCGEYSKYGFARKYPTCAGTCAEQRSRRRGKRWHSRCGGACNGAWCTLQRCALRAVLPTVQTINCPDAEKRAQLISELKVLTTSSSPHLVRHCATAECHGIC